MKVYCLIEVQMDDTPQVYGLPRIAYCSNSITKVVEYTKETTGVEISELDKIELDSEEYYGYKIQEIEVDSKGK